MLPNMSFDADTHCRFAPVNSDVATPPLWN